jgi:hypothetical protein
MRMTMKLRNGTFYASATRFSALMTLPAADQCPILPFCPQEVWHETTVTLTEYFGDNSDGLQIPSDRSLIFFRQRIIVLPYRSQASNLASVRCRLRYSPPSM